jgi:predicted nucleic acid-binding protein
MKKDRLFLDTNVVIDFLDERVPFYEPIARIVTLADSKIVVLVASALSYPTVDYVLSKIKGKERVKANLRRFKIVSEISALNESVIEKGLNSKFTDFEDSLQYYCALQANCAIIITRDVKDFKESTLPVMTPEAYLRSLSGK